jgi:hypothetical protein
MDHTAHLKIPNASAEFDHTEPCSSVVYLLRRSLKGDHLLGLLSEYCPHVGRRWGVIVRAHNIQRRVRLQGKGYQHHSALTVAIVLVWAIFRRNARRNRQAQPQGPPATPAADPRAHDKRGRRSTPSTESSRSHGKVLLTAVNLVGTIVLFLAADLAWHWSATFHGAAIADPASLQQDLHPGAIAIIFNQPVTGRLNATLDFRSHPGSSNVNISGTLHRKPSGTTPLRWAIYSYGSLKLVPQITVDLSEFSATSGGVPGAKSYCRLVPDRVLIGIMDRICTGPDIITNVHFPENPIAVNYNPLPACPIRKNADIQAVMNFVNCFNNHLNDPNLVPGQLELHTGSTDLGKASAVNFSIEADAAGPFTASGGGRIEGVTGAIGGTDVAEAIYGSIATLKDFPPYSQSEFARALKGFQVASGSLRVDETVITDWTDANGILNQDVSLLSSSQPFANPRQLYFSPEPGQSSQANVWWELENRLQVEDAQSQDFLAGVLAAVAATAALMCLALLGSTIRSLVLPER